MAVVDIVAVVVVAVVTAALLLLLLLLAGAGAATSDPMEPAMERSEPKLEGEFERWCRPVWCSCPPADELVEDCCWNCLEEEEHLAKLAAEADPRMVLVVAAEAVLSSSSSSSEKTLSSSSSDCSGRSATCHVDTGMA